MPRFFIQLSFKGTNYHGWQSQPNANTIQAEIEKALATLTNELTETTGAGRTDAGVHARNYIAHFDTDHNLAKDPADFAYKLNAILPGDISVHKIIPVIPDAHARYSAISRTYEYTISRVKDPFNPEFSWYYPLPLEFSAMNEASAVLKNFTDFTSFSKLHSDVKTNNCKVFEASWTIEDSKMVFTIKADRFLRNMVRAIVGTMIDIGKGRLKVFDLQNVIEGKNRSLAGFSVPAQGLMLCEIEYPEEVLK